MLIFPAIDLYEGQAVRLIKGDYAQKTVYSDNPLSVAQGFQNSGAKQIHIVDLEGAKSGLTPNFHLIAAIKKETNLFVQTGGGIRDLDTVKRYMDAGIDRVILGTAAVENKALVEEAVHLFGAQIAVGIDIKDGFAAIKGWLETSRFTAQDFILQMQEVGISTLICTDISKDGMMAGPNAQLYRSLSAQFPQMALIASGGVSALQDVIHLNDLGLYGAIIGKALYTNAINLTEAIEVTK